MAWQKDSGYNVRARVESQIGRWKRVIGDGLRFHTDEAQVTEVAIAVEVLNRMLDLGRPNPSASPERRQVRASFARCTSLQHAVSGMNAIAHAVEALDARSRNPVTSLMAEEGIAALARALPRIVQAPEPRRAHGRALWRLVVRECLGTVGMALHHKLCHVLGGSFGLPHAETHTIVLPHAVAYNAAAAPAAMARIARALGAADAAMGLFDLAGRLGAKRALRDVGMPAAGIDEVVARTMADPYWNPRLLDAAAIRELIVRAWHGHSPGPD